MADVAPARADPRPRSTTSSWLAPVLLVVAIVLAYANTLSAPFLFDDAGAVLNNPTIRRLDSLAILQPPADGSTTTGRPVVNFSFALNYAISGESPWSYHVVNLAIHVFAALTLLGLLRRTLPLIRGRNLRAGDSPGPSRASSSLPALLAASLWALHPLQTESVTCIAQRTESLCGLFYLLTLYAFVRGSAVLQPALARAGVRNEAEHCPRPSPRLWLGLSVVSCAIGMATKEVMVTAPVIVFLYDRTFVAGSFAAAWRARRGYYLALGGTWFALLFLLLAGAGARGASAGFGLGLTPWTYLLKQCEALVLYLRLSLWPHPLVLDYGSAVVRSVAEVWWQGIFVLVLLAATVWALVRRPVLGFVGAWFFLILAPSSSVIPLVTQTMAEHRMYLPLAALASVFVVALVSRLGARVTPLLCAVTVAAFAATVARNHTYRDAVAIWTDNVSRFPANPRGHHNLALALHHAGRVAESHPHFARALELDPAYVTGHFNWAMALLAEARVAEALTQLEATVRLAPEHLEAHRELAVCAEQAGRVVDLEKHLDAILRLAPDDLAAHRKLGLLQARTERLAPAAGHFRAVLRLVPGDADAHANLGNVLLLGGRVREAIASYEQALRLRPDDPRTRDNLQLAREALR